MPLPDLHTLIDPERLERLKELALSERVGAASLSHLTQLTRRVIGAPAAFISLVEAERQLFLSHAGLPEPLAARKELPLTHSICAHAIELDEGLVIPDTRLDPRVADNGMVVEYGVRAYAGIPIKLQDGVHTGSLCVIDFEPHAWSEEQIALLADLAQAVITDFERHEASLRRAHAEKERDATQRFLHQVLDASPDIIYIYDAIERRNSFSNHEFSDVLGYTPDQIAAMASGMIVELVHPDDMPMLIERNLRLAKAPVGTVSEDEYRMRHADGNYRWLRAREIVLDLSPDGTARRLLGVAQDITRRRQMEAAQRETVQRLTLMRRVDIELLRTLDLQGALSVAMDAALRVTNASDAFIGLLEGDQLRMAYVAGSYERDGVLPIDSGIVGRALRSGRAELLTNVSANPAYVAYLPGTRAQMILPLVYRDRAVGVMVLDSRRTDRLTTDTFEFMKLIIDRITVSIENALLFQLAQDRLAQLTVLYDRVRQLEQLKTDMIRLAAHDLRSPLNVLIMRCDLLLEDETLTPPQREGIVEAYKAAEKMHRMISDILSLERIEAMSNLEREAVALSSLVESVAQQRRPEAHSKGVAFSLMLPGSSVVIEADPVQIREALDNLIGNAIKYTPTGGSVTVRLSERGGQAVVEVEDSGPGIPDALQPRLFTPFFRTRSAETEAAEGTGLGLHLVKNIIERHGGRVRFQSTYGRGSMFGFEMPSVRTGVLRPKT